MYLDFDRVAEKDAIKLEMWITPQFHKSKQSGLQTTVAVNQDTKFHKNQQGKIFPLKIITKQK